MKKYNTIIIYLIFIISVFLQPIKVQATDKNTRDLINRAMKDELNRNFEHLKMENLETPFFISYTIRDGKTFEIKAALGSIIESQELPFRNQNVRVMVGSYQRNDENYFDFSTLYNQGSRYNFSIPIEDNYDGIRRALWILTDNIFKKAAEQYERKNAAINAQNLPLEIADLADFSKSISNKLIESPSKFNIDKTRWEEIAKEISGSFIKYPEIFNSELRIFFYQADEYIVNSEGTEIIKPLNLAAIQINAFTQAEDGQELTDHILHYAPEPDELPSKDDILQEVNRLIEKLIALRHAPVFNDSYSGPVMFEGEAAAEFFAQRFFKSSNGLLAVRKPFVSDPNAIFYINQQYGESLENRIEKRITSKEITIKANPSLSEYNGIKLIGNYKIDEEGVKPPEEIILVQNGILKTLLCNRTPTTGVQVSNGHQRPVIGPWQTNTCLGPGVINIQANSRLSNEKIKSELIQLAKDEGLEYGILITKIKSTVTGKTPGNDMMSLSNDRSQQKKMLDKPIYVYRVYVRDGKEELVRSVDIDDPSISTLKHIAGISEQQIVYNNLMPSSNNYSPYEMSGIPVSFITPNAILLEELEIRTEKRNYNPKLPCVESPFKK